jgi:hypothetical protein
MPLFGRRRPAPGPVVPPGLPGLAEQKFRSLDEISSRVTEVLGIVTAIPGPVMPSRVDHSADDLVARISRLDDVNDAIAFCRT